MRQTFVFWLVLAGSCVINALVLSSRWRVEQMVKRYDRKFVGLKLDHERDLRDTLTYLRGEPAQIRYEIDIIDWGQEHLDMRYRWTIWDADRLLALKVSPIQPTVGTTLPYMLGNAPTQEMADAQALAWVHERGANRVVITVPPLKKMVMP